METKSVNYKHEDRQWDARINVQSDEYLAAVVESIKLEHSRGGTRYVLVGGVEVGTRPNQSDYQIKHIHVAVIYNNRHSKASILKTWGIVEGNGYYLVPRNRDLPYAGWREHHVKEFTKVDPNNCILFEAGELPKDQGTKRTICRSDEEKKLTSDEVIKKIKSLLEENKDEEAFNTYPRTFLLYGERIKSRIIQKKPTSTRIHPHIWIYGFPGTGKTAVMNFIYPHTYKKDLNNRFFDLYDDKIHDHIMLEDLDHQNVERLGIQFLKTLCDESGFPIDQKYKTPQLTKSTILVTSNFCIDDIIPDGKGNRGMEETKRALHRRFMHVRIDNFLRILGIKLLSKYECNMLKQAGNQDPKAMFMDWDYVQDAPTGDDIKDPTYYQDLILGYYYSA